MNHIRLAQTVGQRTPNPALPASHLQQTSQRVSYPLFPSTPTSQRIKYIKKDQQKQFGMFKHQSDGAKLLDIGLTYSIQSQVTTICINQYSSCVQLSSLR